ncbi:MAG: VCBS repeat-containing protein [Pseudomonadota bacterium]
MRILSSCAMLVLLAGCPTEQTRPLDDSRACTPANHCRLVDGVAECEPGYTWNDPDESSGDLRCVAVVDAGAPDSGAADLGPFDVPAPDTAVQDAGVPSDAASADLLVATDAYGPDLAVVSDAAQPDNWVPPTGAPTFDLPYRYPDLPAGYQLLDDVNADGRLDAVQVESFNPYDSLNLRIQLAQVSGGFAPSFEATVAGHAGRVLAVCDFDGDGKVDLLLGSGNRPVSYLFTSLGAGQFATPPQEVSYTYGADSFRDFDSNGRCDVLELQGAFGYSAGSVTLHLAQASGGPIDVLVDNLHYGSTGVGDVDGDGRLDLVLAGTGYPYKLLVYRLLADNSLQPWGGDMDCPSCNDASQIVVRDLDGDGDGDVVLGASDLTVFTNSGSTLSAAASLSVDDPQALAVADVDGDSHPDLIAISQPVPTTANDGLEILYGPAYTDVRRFYNLSGSRRISRIIDHNGDGKRDVILDDELVYAGMGGRELMAPRLSLWPTASSSFYYATRYFILEADATPGLEVASSMRSSFRMAHVGSDLRFASEAGCSGLFDDNAFPNADLILKDLTGDGLVDLLLGNDQGAHLRVGQGGCSFGAEAVIVPSAYASWLDVTGDGLADALWHASGTLNVALATTPGVYGSAVTSFLAGDYYSYTAAPLDSGTSIDLVLLGYDTNAFLVATGDGAGHFVSAGAQAMGTASDRIVDVETLDYDGDGDVDLLMSLTGTAPRVELLRNDGTAHFAIETVLTEQAGSYNMYLGVYDFDGDGSPELWVDQGRAQGIFALDGSVPATALARLNLDFAWPADVDGDGDADLCFIDDYDGRAIFAVAANRAR